MSGVTHQFITTVPDSGRQGEVSSDEWNGPHVVDQSSVLLGRVSPGAGVIEALTAIQAKVLLAIQIGDVVGLASVLSLFATSASLAAVAFSGSAADLGGSLPAAQVSGLAVIATSGSASDLGTGTLPAGRMPALSGDLSSVAGSAAPVIAAHAVTNAKAAQMPTATLKGNATGGTADAADLTVAQVKALLSLAIADITGLAAALATFATTASLAAIAFSGSGGDLAAGSVTNAKLANMAAATLKGSVAGGSPADLSAAAVKGILSIAAGDVSGLAVTATSTDAANLTGTLAAARIAAASLGYAKLQDISATKRVLGRNTAGAGVTEEVTATQLLDWVSTTNGVLLTRTSGTWGAITKVGTDGVDLLFSEDTGPATPAAGKVAVFGSSLGGRQMLAQLGPTGARMIFQPHIGQQKPFRWIVGLNNAITAEGMINGTAVNATATGGTIATTNLFTQSRRVNFATTTTTAASVVGFRNTTAFISRQQGFSLAFRCGISDASIVTTGRTFWGLQGITTAPSDADPSGLANILGIGTDANDTTLQLYAAGAAAQARTALVITAGPNVGGSFPMNTASVDVYELAFGVGPASGSITYQVTRLNTGDIATGTISAAANLPASSTLLTPQLWRSNGTTASAVSITLFSMYGDTDT